MSKTAVKISVSNGKYVVRLDEGTDERVVGAEKIRAVGGGVQARLAKRKSDGKFFVETIYFDRDRFSEESVQQWIEKHEKSLVECMRKIQESAPSGSFTDIALRVQRAVNLQDFFSSGYAYIEWMFKDYCVVRFNDKLYRLEYDDAEGTIALGTPAEVDIEYVKKECAAAEAALEQKSRPNFHFRENVAVELGEFKEADAKKREVVCVLIEAGINHTKKRYYPKETLKRAVECFAGLKMFLDHQTASEERDQPERSLEDWVATIKEAWYEDGKVMGRVHVHDDWLWEKLESDQTFREHIAISINGSGKSYFRQIEGQNVQVVEVLTDIKSVDWVTEPGARGRVDYVLQEKQKREDLHKMKNVTLKEMKTERPDLVESIETEVRAKMKGETDAAIKEATDKAVAEALKPYKAKEAERALAAIREKATKIVEKSALPKKAIPAFVEKFLKSNGSEVTEENVETKAKEAVAAEIKYLNEAGAGIKVGVEGRETTEEVKESGGRPVASEGFLTSVGLADKK